MERRPFGFGAPPVPVVGQGTWQMELNERKRTIAALRRGLELGMTHIDTAELYGDGEVESLVGEAIAGRRDDVFLVSKVKPSNATFTGTILACERSLRRLRTDHLDVYLLHWPGDHPLADTIHAFERLADEGKIRAWGVSNFDVTHLRAAVDIAGERRVACNQVLYHLDERDIEHAVIPWCEQHGVAVVGYSPFGSGSFPTTRGGPGRVLEEIAQAHGVTPRAVALRFLVRRTGLFAIPKASRAEHVEDNARAGALELTDEDFRQIDAAFPLGEKKAELPVI